MRLFYEGTVAATDRECLGCLLFSLIAGDPSPWCAQYKGGAPSHVLRWVQSWVSSGLIVPSRDGLYILTAYGRKTILTWDVCDLHALDNLGRESSVIPGIVKHRPVAYMPALLSCDDPILRQLAGERMRKEEKRKHKEEKHKRRVAWLSRVFPWFSKLLRKYTSLPI